jgi:hypothetical protein
LRFLLPFRIVPPHPGALRKVVILQGVKVVCFDRDLKVCHSMGFKKNSRESKSTIANAGGRVGADSWSSGLMHDSLGLADLRLVLATVLGRGSLLDKYTKRHLLLSSKMR